MTLPNCVVVLTLDLVQKDLKALQAALESEYGLSPYWQGRLRNTIGLVDALRDEVISGVE